MPLGDHKRPFQSRRKLVQAEYSRFQIADFKGETVIIRTFRTNERQLRAGEGKDAKFKTPNARRVRHPKLRLERLCRIADRNITNKHVRRPAPVSLTIAIVSPNARPAS